MHGENLKLNAYHVNGSIHLKLKTEYLQHVSTLYDSSPGKI